MTDWHIRFIGHIDETRRPVDFPKEIYSDLYVRADNPTGLRQAINSQCQVFINEDCMIVPKDPGAIEEFTAQHIPADSRMLVPFHMLTHITTVTKRIIGEIPQLDENNVPQVSDGSKVRIQ